MVSILINGDESGISGEGLPKFADLVELIKSTIDPDHMITSILVNGKELADDDWMAPMSRFDNTSIVEIETGMPSTFVAERMGTAADIISNCYMQFRECRKLFQAGNMQAANEKLSAAVYTLKAFFDWYASMMALISQEEQQKYGITTEIGNIAEICKKIVEQQMYQSWWTLGETLKTSLEPELDRLEDRCREFTSAQ
ncbi:MAG: hypothetical protein KDD56_05640 [Bdellovibrionales bacterium]|nr:hypothetical protein [Bdellovibrionales bacterium]